MKRRILSIITALALCLSLCPAWAFAAEADPALCKHHPAHTEDCGYTVPAEGQPCGHEHTAECYALEVLPDTESGDDYEIGADTENLLDCQHVHDSECGYVQANPGQPCGYECRICPIEDLIAALPDKVTEDNAEDVRAQLDKILALFGELTEDEQEQIDLSCCYALQAALDGANFPMPLATGNVTLTADDREVIFTVDECGNSCQGHTITQNAQSGVVTAAKILVESGTHDITFSGLNLTSAAVGIMPGGTMNLTLVGTNKIVGSGRGFYVPVGATLVITE